LLSLKNTPSSTLRGGRSFHLAQLCEALHRVFNHFEMVCDEQLRDFLALFAAWFLQCASRYSVILLNQAGDIYADK
jgi:hypothetical protein